MIAMLLAAVLLQDVNWTDQLGAVDRLNRISAMSKMVEMKRKARPILKEALEKGNDLAKDSVGAVVSAIAQKEVDARMAAEGRADGSWVLLDTMELRKTFPWKRFAAWSPTKFADDNEDPGKRFILVDDYDAEQFIPIYVEKFEDLAKHLAAAPATEAEARAVAAGVAVLVRAYYPKAHVDGVLPHGDGDNWWLPEQWKVDGKWKVSGIVLQIHHEWHNLELSFDGGKTAVKVTGTGRACK